MSENIRFLTGDRKTKDHTRNPADPKVELQLNDRTLIIISYFLALFVPMAGWKMPWLWAIPTILAVIMFCRPSLSEMDKSHWRNILLSALLVPSFMLPFLVSFSNFYDPQIPDLDYLGIAPFIYIVYRFARMCRLMRALCFIYFLLFLLPFFFVGVGHDTEVVDTQNAEKRMHETMLFSAFLLLCLYSMWRLIRGLWLADKNRGY